MEVALTILKDDKRVLAKCTRQYRSLALYKRCRPSGAANYIRRAWNRNQASQRAEFVSLLQTTGANTQNLADDAILDRVLESMRRGQVVVYTKRMKPHAVPVRASLDTERWWVALSPDYFKQNIVRYLCERGNERDWEKHLPVEFFKQTAQRHRVLPAKALEQFDRWFPVETYDEAETGLRLAGLKRACWRYSYWGQNNWVYDNHADTLQSVAAWAREAFRRGELCAYEELKAFTVSLSSSDAGKPLTAAAYIQNAKAYAEQYDINLGREKPVTELVPIPKEKTVKPGQKLADAPQFYKSDKPETDRGALDNKVDDTCPSHNCRSESAKTVKESGNEDAIKDFFGGEAGYKAHGNETLGCEGGGGLLASTTRVVELPEPDTLWRYCGGDGKEGGSWWTVAPLEGDPRVECALPPKDPNNPLSKGSTGGELVACRIDKNKPIKVLMGIGAPRCSNKPGGPVQICLSYRAVGDPKTGIKLVTHLIH